MSGSVQHKGTREARGRTRSKHTVPQSRKKALPPVVKEIQVESDYAVVKQGSADLALKVRGFSLNFHPGPQT